MSVSLLYHDIVEGRDFSASGFAGADANIYKLEEALFAAHLDAIARRGAGEAAGLFTFDDGGAAALRAADHLERHGWRGCFFITTDFIGRTGFLSRAGILELSRRGHLVGSHSCSHPPRMAALSEAELLREWRDSLAALSDITGEPTRVASVPGGYYSKRVAETAARSGIEQLYTSEPIQSMHRVSGMLVRGRYSIQQSTSASAAAALASGDLLPRLRQYGYWNVKKIVKAAGGRYWLSFRRYYLARSRKDA